MNKTLMMTAIAALSVALSGCDKKPEAPKADVPKVAGSTYAMSNMAMPEGSKMGKGSGTVTAVDTAEGKITLDHGAIPAVDWPAMKIGFSAKPALLKGIAIGDKVDFDLTVTGNAGEVTAIKKH